MKMVAGTMGESRQLPKKVEEERDKNWGHPVWEGLWKYWSCLAAELWEDFATLLYQSHLLGRENSLLAQQEVSYYKTDCLILGSLCSATTTLFLCLLLPL